MSTTAMSSNAPKSRFILDQGDAIKKVSHDVVCADHNFLTGWITARDLRKRYHETLVVNLNGINGLAGLLGQRYPTYEMAMIAVMLLEHVGIYMVARPSTYMEHPVYVLVPWVTTD